MKLKPTLCCAFILITPSAACAGDVYKCNASGTPVYQDMPCAGGNKLKMRDSASSTQTASSADSLGTLYRKVQAASATERRLRNAMERDIAATKARLGSKVNEPSSNAEAERIKNEWLPRIRAASHDFDSLMEEIKRRCPHGASLNASRQTCNK